jgi:hypothetical protein
MKDYFKNSYGSVFPFREDYLFIIMTKEEEDKVKAELCLVLKDGLKVILYLHDDDVDRYLAEFEEWINEKRS